MKNWPQANEKVFFSENLVYKVSIPHKIPYLRIISDVFIFDC